MLTALLLIALALYALHRLAALITRMESAHTEASRPTLWVNQHHTNALLKDAAAAVVLAVLYTACLWLAFAL